MGKFLREVIKLILPDCDPVRKYRRSIFMLNDNQCFKLVRFMVAVIAIFASTGHTIINTFN